MRRVFIFLMGALSLTGYAQQSLNDIDLNRIPQKKIREFIHTQIDNQIMDFRDVEASYQKGQDLSEYRNIVSTYVIKENLNKVWEKYLSVSPAQSWNSKMISFGLLFSKLTDSIIYKNDLRFPEFDTSQVFYVNLKILKGIYNLAVGLEIVAIDDIGKIIQFSYLKGGKSQGLQTMQFVTTDEGYTQIIHSTNFKSNSPFRDRFIYPYFHNKIIGEFHTNMKHFVVPDNHVASRHKKHSGING